MKRINIREALLDMDRATDCEFDLTSLYEACCLDDKKKEKLVQYIDAYDIDATNKFLSNEATSQGLMEEVADDLSDDELKDIMGEAVVHMTDETTFNPLVRTQSLKVGDMVYDEDTGHKCKVLNIINDGKYSKQIALGDTVNQRTYTQISGNNALWEVAVENDSAHEVDDDVDIELHSPTELLSEKTINEELWDISRANELATYYLDGGSDYNTLQLCNIIRKQMKEEGCKLPDNLKYFYDAVYKTVYEYYNSPVDDSEIIKQGWVKKDSRDCTYYYKGDMTIIHFKPPFHKESFGLLYYGGKYYRGTDVGDFDTLERAAQVADMQVANMKTNGGYIDVTLNDAVPIKESTSDDTINEELWDSSRVIDLVNYYLDRSNLPDNELVTRIMQQMKEEGSKLPYNITDFYDAVYKAIFDYNEKFEDGSILESVSCNSLNGAEQSAAEKSILTEADNKRFTDIKSCLWEIIVKASHDKRLHIGDFNILPMSSFPETKNSIKCTVTNICVDDVNVFKTILEEYGLQVVDNPKFFIPKGYNDVDGQYGRATYVISKNSECFKEIINEDYAINEPTVTYKNFIGDKEVPYTDYNDAKAHFKDDYKIEDYREELQQFLNDRCGRQFNVDVTTDGRLFIDITWGDWKHDHLRADHLVDKFFAEKGLMVDVDKVTTEEDGSDCYSAEHYYTLSDFVFTQKPAEDLDEGILGDLGKVAKAGAKAIGNKIANTKTYQKIKPTVDKVVDKVKNNDVVKSVVDTAKQTPTATRIKDAKDVRGVQANIKAARSAEEIAAVEAQIQELQSSGKLHTNNHMNYLMKQLGDRKKQLGIKDDPKKPVTAVTESMVGETRDIFCVDCDTVTSQTYKGSFKDGYHTLGRYICTRCGCENNDEVLTEAVQDPQEVLDFKQNVEMADSIDEIRDLISDLSDAIAEDNCSVALYQNRDKNLDAIKEAVIVALDVYLEDNEWLGDDLDEDLTLDTVVTVGIYGDEDNSLGITSMDELVNYFQKKGIEVISKDGDMDYGWDLGLRGNPRDIFLAVNDKFTGYNCSSVQEFVDQYQVDDNFFNEAVATKLKEGYQLRYRNGAAMNMSYYTVVFEDDKFIDFKDLMWTDKDKKIIRVDKSNNKAFYKNSGENFGYLDECKPIKEANKIALGNEKYKGYMIRQDHKYGGYNVYDKNDEMEDSGFKSIQDAKKFIDDTLSNMNEIFDEKLVESIDDTVDLEYSDLTVTYDTRPSSWNMWTDGDDWEEHERKMDYTLTVDKEEIVTFLIEECVSEDDVPNMSQMSDDELEQFIINNFDNLFTKYEQIIKDKWEEEATERATEHYLENKDYYDEPDYELMYGDE